MIHVPKRTTIYTPDDICGLLRLSKPKVYELFAREDFPSIRIGRSHRISAESFEDWFKNQE